MNDIKLQEGHPVDENLRPVKVGGVPTALEVSKTDVRVNNFTVNGTTTGVVATDTTKLPLTGGTMTGDINVPDGFTLDSPGDINIDAAGNYILFKNDGTQFGGIDMGTGSNLKLTSQTDYHLSLFSLGIGDVVVDSNGDIILDSNDGNFIMRKAGVQFSPANSAYAGMILGYTDIGLNEVHASLSLTTSFVVPTDEFSVSFIAPPSGNVAIEFQIQMGFGSSGVGDLAADLSTANATSGYSQLAAHHAATFLGNGARNAYATARGSWTLTGLTAGTSYEYWAAFKTDSTSGTPILNWGGTALRYPDFIMKATALPATITT